MEDRRPPTPHLSKIKDVVVDPRRLRLALYLWYWVDTDPALLRKGHTKVKNWAHSAFQILHTWSPKGTSHKKANSSHDLPCLEVFSTARLFDPGTRLFSRSSTSGWISRLWADYPVLLDQTVWWSRLDYLIQRARLSGAQSSHPRTFCCR